MLRPDHPSRLFPAAYPLAFLVTVTVVTSLLGSSVQAAPPGWNSTWADEFDGDQVDLAKWEPVTWTTPHNQEQQAYHPSRVTVAGGHLALTADDADSGDKPYTSGKVESNFAQRFGRWEIRARLPGTVGTWPAIWLLPETDDHPWPSQGEIDIMENRGHQPRLTSSAFHWGPNSKGRKFLTTEQQSTQGGQPANYHQAFHTYAVEWDATKLRFFVDDVHYHTVTNEQTKTKAFPEGFLATQTAAMEVNLNVAVGGSFLGDEQPNGSSEWPQQMLVDYVRVYERDANPPPARFQNGSFESPEGSPGGSLAGWSTFGNVQPNVQTGHEVTALEGNQTLKLFGQFSSSENYSGVSQGISVTAGDTLSASASALVPSVDDLVGANSVVLKFDYFSDFGGLFDSSSYLGSSAPVVLADAATANDTWHEFQLTDTAPAEAVEARLVLVFIQPSGEGGSAHIDQVRFENLDLQENADDDKDREGASFSSGQQDVSPNVRATVATDDFDSLGSTHADSTHASESPLIGRQLR